MRTIIILLFTIILLFNSYRDYAQKADSNDLKLFQDNKKLLKSSIIPTLLICYGVSVLDDNGLFYSSYDAYDDIRKNYPGFPTDVDNYLWFCPAAGPVSPGRVPRRGMS